MKPTTSDPEVRLAAEHFWNGMCYMLGQTSGQPVDAATGMGLWPAAIKYAENAIKAGSTDRRIAEAFRKMATACYRTGQPILGALFEGVSEQLDGKSDGKPDTDDRG